MNASSRPRASSSRTHGSSAEPRRCATTSTLTRCPARAAKTKKSLPRSAHAPSTATGSFTRCAVASVRCPPAAATDGSTSTSTSTGPEKRLLAPSRTSPIPVGQSCGTVTRNAARSERDLACASSRFSAGKEVHSVRAKPSPSPAKPTVTVRPGAAAVSARSGSVVCATTRTASSNVAAPIKAAWSRVIFGARQSITRPGAWEGE